MGVLANTKQFLANKTVAMAKKAGDGIATMSALSPKQLQEVDKKRAAYLSEKPDMNGIEAQSTIQKNMGAIGIEVYQAYLEQLGNIYYPMDSMLENFDEDNRIRFFDITKWVMDAEEKSLDKLVNVYHVLSEEDCNIALIYNRTKDKCTVSIGVVNTSEEESDPAIADKFYARILGAIRGNFPGADIVSNAKDNKCFGIGVPESLEKACKPIDSDGCVKSVAIVSNVASEKSEDFISQSMEKLLDGIVPKNDAEEYTIVLLAKPERAQLATKNRLFELYTALAPYASWSTNHTYTESDATGSSATFGASIGAGIGVSHSTTNTESMIKKQLPGDDPLSFDEFDKLLHGVEKKSDEFVQYIADSANSIHEGEAKLDRAKKALSDIKGVVANLGDKIKSIDANTIKGAAKRVENGVGRVGYKAAEVAGIVSAPTVSLAKAATTTISPSLNFGVDFSRTSNTSTQVGINDGITQTYTNYGVKHTLEIIESQLKRIEESSALGMWEFASYIISDSPVIANNVAHMYLALTQGEESYITKSAVNFWDGDIQSDAAKNILSSVQKLQHPIFGLKTSIDDEWLMYPTLVTPTTPLSGKELAKALNFPRKSVSGLPVLEVVSFGREPHSLLEEELDLDIGSGYHMRKRIAEQRVSISKEELTKHTFITGSTGSGKSNTIYRLLERLGEENVNFLVVEPAKGEYKDVLGKKKGVITYGTNPNLKGIEMLKINPFRFPEHTHILEHLDRLIEIFNVCWPMYAAMPAILKDSVERAYVKAGWDLELSVNKYDNNLFPTFGDVVNQIKEVLEESDYSADNKGDYTGSLVTRLKSLTNGINGLIFSSNDLKDEVLFDRCAIVDLSRVGSSETKSLIMGLLVLKLQEHRMEQRCVGANANDKLKHITVLEEAHNLLKRTSTEQSSEGSNMLGKSVEMLANSIAEMRTYGEGFVIADQSPGLLDMSVIRNTNTKIILRLPDFSDRELVGKSAGLSDNQIIELAKLEKGVAAISQSDWLEPVLCKIDKYEGNGQPFMHSLRTRSGSEEVDTKAVSKNLLELIMSKEIYRNGDRVDIQKLKGAVIKSKLDTSVKCDFIEYISAGKKQAVEALRTLVYDFLEAEKAIDASKGCGGNIKDWVHSVVDHMEPQIKDYSSKQIDLMMALMLQEKIRRDTKYRDLYCRFTQEYKDKGGVF